MKGCAVNKPATEGARGLDSATLRIWMEIALDALTRARGIINAANVFPVADSDTGTNLVLTLARAHTEVSGLPASATVSQICNAIAAGAAQGARGNSGIIMAEYLRGFAVSICARDETGEQISPKATVKALKQAAKAARRAVVEPRFGTILTCARQAAEQAKLQSQQCDDLSQILQRGCFGAYEALGASVFYLEELRSAGVMDSGAYGMALLLEALYVAHLGGIGQDIVIKDSLRLRGLDKFPVVSQSGQDECGAEGNYEVVCKFATNPQGHLDYLTDLGSSVVVTAGTRTGAQAGEVSAGFWQVHIHTDDPGQVLARLDVVRDKTAMVRNLQLQRTQKGGPGVVVCTRESGLVEELALSGAVVLWSPTGIEISEILHATLENTTPQVWLIPHDEQTFARCCEFQQQLEHHWHHGTKQWWALGGQENLQVTVVKSLSDLQAVYALGEVMQLTEFDVERGILDLNLQRQVFHFDPTGAGLELRDVFFPDAGEHYLLMHGPEVPDSWLDELTSDFEVSRWVSGQGGRDIEVVRKAG